MNTIKPWSIYQAQLMPMANAQKLGMASSQQFSSEFAFEAYAQMLAKVNVAFFTDLTDAEYHLVQMGEDVPDWERLLAWRQIGSSPTRSWKLPRGEAGNFAFLNQPISAYVAGLSNLKRQWEEVHPAAADTSYWQAFRLIMRRAETNNASTWLTTIAALQHLEQRGFTAQDIHDLLHHCTRWQGRNPEFAGVPSELVQRMHGLGPVLETGFTGE